MTVRVALYTGMSWLARRSGVGVAIRNQARLYRLLGWDQTDNPFADYDLVHLNTVFPDTPLVAAVAALRRKKIVMHAHSTEEDFRSSFPWSNLFSGAFRWWIMALYRMGDVVLTPTEYSKNLLMSYGLDRPIEVISNGVDRSVFHPDSAAGRRFRQRHGLDDQQRVVISVGLPIERKGVDDAIELARRMPEVTFIWFGALVSVLVPHKIRHEIKTSPPNMIFAGFVSPDRLVEAYCGTDVFLMATHEETEGIVMLEALACHAPVLVRDIPIYQGWLVEGKQVWKANDVDGFEERLRHMLSGELPDLTTAGAVVAAERDLTQVAAQLADIYTRNGLIRPESSQATPSG